MAWLNNLDVVTLFVGDVATSKKFYQETFGLDAIFEGDDSVMFNLDNARINLLRRTSAPDFVAPARLAPPEAGVSAQYTIHVDNVDEACAELTRRGVTLVNGPIDRPWGTRTASFVDPDGYLWEIAE